jgi:rubrerythrin
MPKIKGSKTEKNLLATFAGESQARNRYTYAGSVAKKEGFIQIANIFEETAENEKEHAKRMFKFLEGGPLEITATYPAGKTGKTLENLEMAADGEKEEHTTLYPSFAKMAREEGFEDVAKMYESVSVAEKQHEKRYRSLIENLKKGFLFKKPTSVKWRCSNCGYIHEGNHAPDSCPACQHPQSYFEVLSENW